MRESCLLVLFSCSLFAATLSADTCRRWRYWEGVDNVRDFGGLATTNGVAVREGRIYRSQAFNANALCSWWHGRRLVQQIKNGTIWNEMGEKTARELLAEIDLDDITNSCERIARRLRDDKSFWRQGAPHGSEQARRRIVETTGLRTEIDLRSDEECWGMTGSPLGSSVRWLHLPCQGSMTWFVTDEGKAFFRRLFDVFLHEENYPIDIHCIAGADRTGCVAILLEGLLGVTDREIEMDYRLTTLSSSGTRTAEGFRRATKALLAYPGATWAERTSEYVRSCGISEEECERFRSLMLMRRNKRIGE